MDSFIGFCCLGIWIGVGIILGLFLLVEIGEFWGADDKSHLIDNILYKIRKNVFFLVIIIFELETKIV
jgi:hypothetical protein